jgi:hypothetical protein
MNHGGFKTVYPSFYCKVMKFLWFFPWNTQRTQHPYSKIFRLWSNFLYGGRIMFWAELEFGVGGNEAPSVCPASIPGHYSSYIILFLLRELSLPALLSTIVFLRASFPSMTRAFLPPTGNHPPYNLLPIYPIHLMDCPRFNLYLF